MNTLTAENAYQMILNGCKSPEVLEVVAKHPMHAYFYALDVVNGRWPEGEKAIATYSVSAYLYACNIVKGRWPEGEDAIATDPETEKEYNQFLENLL